jgi:glycosyltransferase involved in cell wall biosynthesis
MLTNALAPDKTGGLERYVRDLAGTLVRRGHAVTVVTKSVGSDFPRREVAADGVRIVRYRVPSKADPLFAARYPAAGVRDALHEASRARAGVLHAHFPVPAWALAVVRRRYLYTFHAPLYRELLSERQRSYVLPRPVQQAAVAGIRRTERLVVRRATQVVVLSDFTRGELAALDDHVAADAALIPGGVDRDRFRPGAVGADDWAEGGAPLLFAARRLTPRTGLRELVEAMPAVLRSLPRARLAVAGEGLMRGEIQAELDALGLGGVVRLLGHVDDDALVEWYRRADLVVLPTQELEGFGLTTAEALACGTPVLGTPVGATPELLAPLDPALVAAGTSPPALAAAVVRVLTDESRLARIAAASRASTARFAWDVVVDRYLALYEELLGARERDSSAASVSA